MTCIVAATAAFVNNDNFLDIVLVADGAMNQNRIYEGIPPTSYLYTIGDVDTFGNIDISPNVWAGGIMPPQYGLSGTGLSNIKGFPGGTTYAGSDIGILYGDGTGHFQFRFVLSGGMPAFVYNPRDVRTGDFDGDGRRDIVVFNNDGGPWETGLKLGGCSVVWYRNEGGPDPVFTEYAIMRATPTPPYPPHNYPAPRDGAVADVDRDGRDDVIVADYQIAPNMFWIQNVDVVGFASATLTVNNYRPINPGNISTPLAIWAGLFDNDNFVDILIGRNSYGAGDGQQITLLKGKSDPEQYNQESVSGINFRCASLAVADFDGDGRNDVVGGAGDPNLDTDYLTVFYSNGGFTRWDEFQLPRANEALGEVAQVIVADFNGDSRQDIAAAFEAEGPANTEYYNGFGMRSNVHVWINQNTGGSRYNWKDFGLARHVDDVSDNDNGALVAGNFTGDSQTDLFNVHFKLPAVLYVNDWSSGRSFNFQASHSRGNGVKTNTLRRVGVRSNLSQGDVNGQSVQGQ